MDKLSRKRLLYGICLTSLDLFLIIGLLLLPLAWLFDPLKINWWHLRLSVGWGWKPVLIPVLILLARIGLVKWVRFVSTKPARGLW